MSLPQNHKPNIALLVDGLNKSSTRAYSQLFDLYWQSMFARAFSLVQNEHAAKDIVQEIWIDIWNRRTSLHDKNFEAYLYKAVRNNCYKYFRSTKFNTVQLALKVIRQSIYTNK